MAIYKDLKVLALQANVSLAHMVRHWTPKPVMISCIRSSPTGGNFCFAFVNSFEYNSAISANFVQTLKNSIGFELSKNLIVGDCWKTLIVTLILQ